MFNLINLLFVFFVVLIYFVRIFAFNQICNGRRKAKSFIFIDNEDINNTFDQQIHALTEGKINMGILETLKMQERRDGRMEGRVEGRVEGRIEGKIEGMIEGRHEEALEIARELKNEGLTIEFIVKITKLSAEEIEKLV